MLINISQGSIISAILGILGAVAAGSVAFAWLEPPLGVAAGVFQALGGGIHLYEGSVKLANTKKILEKNTDDMILFKGLQLMEEELFRINGEHGDDRKTIIGD